MSALPVTRSGFALRPMAESDIAAVMPNEEAAYLYPWTAGIFRDCLRAGYDGWVVAAATAGSRNDNVTAGALPPPPGGSTAMLAGHAMLSYGPDEAHLLNLTVVPELHGQGIGRWLLRYLIDRVRRRPVATLFLEVRPSNHAARHLYRTEGFVYLGLRPRYYPARQGREDAWVYALDLSGNGIPGSGREPT